MSRVTTIKDVALAADVSIASVSNYVNGTKTVSPHTALRIQDAIESLNFVPNRSVRTLRGRSNTSIGLLTPDGSNPFFAELARGVEDTLRESGMLVVSCDTRGLPDRESDYVRRLAEMRVSGVIADSVTTQPIDDGPLRAVGIPLIVLGTDTIKGASSITVDQLAMGKLAAGHLLDLGHRRIAFIAGPGGETVVEDRYRAVVESYVERGIDLSLLMRVDATDRVASAHAEAADAVLGAPDRPTAILAANDIMALNIQNAVIRRGLVIPRDMSIMGFDDIPAASLSIVALSTIRAPAYAIGTTAAEMLLAEIASDESPIRRVTFEPELVVRESTAPPR